MSLNKNIFGKILKWACIVLISLTCLFSTLIVSLGLISSCSSSNIAKADAVDDTYIYYGNNQFISSCHFYRNLGMNIDYNHPNNLVSFDFVVECVPDNDVVDLGFGLASPSFRVPVVSVIAYGNKTPFPMDICYDNFKSENLSSKRTYLDIFRSTSDDPIYLDYYQSNRVYILSEVSSSGVISATGQYESEYYFGGWLSQSGFSGSYFCFRHYGSLYFNSNVRQIEFGHTIGKYSNGSFTENNSILNYIRLYDSNGYSITIEFVTYNVENYADIRGLAWENRTYFNSASLSTEYQEGYDYGFAVGVKTSYDKGKYEGYSDGYDEGKQAGLTEGELKGKTEAWQEANENKFSFQWFLQNTLNILDVKIFGVFSLGDIFKIVLGVSLVIIVLKLFAGG